jgi:pimeloyl-ACP methyl ester carboxylesterase
MPDPMPEPMLTRAGVPPSNGRPVRKDEIELHDRGIYIESWLPERRSRRKPLMFVHGELAGSWVWERFLGYFAGRGWEGHAVNLRNHYWSQTADPVEDVVAALDRLGPTTVAIGHGMGALLTLKAVERVAISGLVLIAPQMPRDLRPPARPYELREVPEVYGRSLIGWETLPERLLRDDRDLTLDDVLRIQHLLGQKPHESGLARRQVIAGIPIDRRVVSQVPRLVIAGGLDRYTSLDDAERLAEWLDAGFEPFGAHSHYGLIHGEGSYQQVAEAVRTFLETHRL